MARRISASPRTTPTADAGLSGANCPTCGTPGLRLKRETVKVIANGEPHAVSGVRSWACTHCRESFFEGRELKRAEATAQGRQAVQMHLRLDADLRDRLAKAAARDRRSINQEVVFLLENGLASSSIA